MEKNRPHKRHPNAVTADKQREYQSLANTRPKQSAVEQFRHKAFDTTPIRRPQKRG